MTAVRRLLIILCVATTAALSAQTTKKGTASNTNIPGSTARPAPITPTTVSADPADAQHSSSTAAPQTPPVTADTDKDLSDPRALRLSLDDAVRTTMERNLGIQIQRYDYQMTGQSYIGQFGIFDPLLTGSFEKSSSKSPTISTNQAASSRSTSANFGVSTLLPTGGSVSAALNSDRQSQVGGGTFVNPSYGAGVVFSANQPLLRNFGTDVTTRGINIARNNLGISQETFRGVLMNTAISVEQAYLDLVYARQFVDVVKEAVFLARDQARITQIRIDVGASAPLDILQPRVQIATQEESLIAAQASVRDAEDRLRQLMHLDPADWDRPIIPTDPATFNALTIDVQDSVNRAYTLRPELREAKYATEIRRVNYLFARNQMLPAVDLNLRYGASGTGGTLFTTDPVTGDQTVVSTTRYPHAFNQVISNDFPAWTIGVSLSVPLFNISARAEAKRAELDFDQSRTLQDQTRETIAIDVRKAARDIETAAREIGASRTAREAAEQNLDAERKRYENGMTTNFNVLQIQQQLSDARVSEIQAVVGYNKAVATYHRAVGDLLDIRHITVEEERPQVPIFFTNYQNWFEKYDFLSYGKRVKNDPIVNEMMNAPQPQEPKP
jgi:outer membrane protein